MAASLNEIGTVQALEAIKKSLVPEVKSHQEILRDDDWDNRWNWDSNELAYENTNKEEEQDRLWLEDCKLALSPLADMFVVGRGQVVAIYQSKTTPSGHEDERAEFELIYTLNLADLSKDETITSIQLLPFVSQQKTSVSLHDWTAILVGFTSGYFRIYAENGKLLMEHLFHDEPVIKLRCRTYSTNTLLNDQLDEILITYPSVVVQIDGFTLYQTLRANRQQLAIGGGSVASSDATQFTFHKWRFGRDKEGQQHDCVAVCNYVRNDYDALVIHSLTGKPLTNDRANLFLVAGVDPYVGFYRAQEGVAHTIIGELSQALFAKVKNVFSIFGGGGGGGSASTDAKQDPREKIKPPTGVECSLALYDHRLGTSVVLSPNRRLAAVADDFGRVVLFDTANGIAVRIWKGYRRAEVGWVVAVADETNKARNNGGGEEHPKQANFLVIYAPKRGILEIWCTQNGPRVAAFNVGKHCRLLHLDHALIGLNHLVLHQMRQKMPASEFKHIFSQSKCFLFDYTTGHLSTVQIPFLCALTDRNSQRTCDLHVLKDFRLLLANRVDYDIEDGGKWNAYKQKLVKLMSMLRTSEMKHQLLELLVKLAGKGSEDIITHLASTMRTELLKAVEQAQLDFEGKLVAQMATRIVQLCRFYGQMSTNWKILGDRAATMVKTSREETPDIAQLIETLGGGWAGTDVARLVSLLAYRASVLKISLEDEMDSFRSEVGFDFGLAEFLSHFTLWYSHLVKQNGQEVYEHLPIEIILLNAVEGSLDEAEDYPKAGRLISTTAADERRSLTSVEVVDLARLARFLFNGILVAQTEAAVEEGVGQLLNECCIFPSNLLLLVFSAWLHASHANHWQCWRCFARALLHIVEVFDSMRREEEALNQAEEENTEEERASRARWLLFDSSNYEDRLLSPSWTNIIELIYKSTNITAALVAVNMIKALIDRFKLSQTDIDELRLGSQRPEEGDEDEDVFGVEAEVTSRLANAGSIVSNTDNEWETLHLDKENLHLLTKQLEDLFLLDMLLKSNLFALKSIQKRDTEAEKSKLNLEIGGQVSREEVSLVHILNSGPGIVSEIVARWVVNHRIEADLLVAASSQEAESIDEEKKRIAMGQDSIELKSAALVDLSELLDQETLMDMLEHVRRCFPNCLDTDILLINCFWEVLLRWHHQPQVYTSELGLALGYLDRVFSAVLRHNVACMAWRVFIQKRLETLCSLIEKMGKRPKDRISRKELAMDENQLEQFTSFVADVLDFMIRNSLSSDAEPLPLYATDDWWSGFNAPATAATVAGNNIATHSAASQGLDDGLMASVNGNIPLATMAMHQKPPNIDLVVVYHHLALVVQFTIVFNLKRAYPLSLFPSTVRAYLFKDLYDFVSISGALQSDRSLITASNEPVAIDPILADGRLKFVFGVVSAIAQTLPVYTGAASDRELAHKFYVTAGQWSERLITLAREWNLPIDQIRSRYVYELYFFGVDPLAQDMIAVVIDKRAMARTLLSVAGMRMLHNLQQHYESLDEVTSLSLAVLRWLRALVADVNCRSDVPIESTITLLHRLVEHLHDDMGNSRIAEELLAAAKRTLKS